MKQPGTKSIAVNRKARHDYFVQETYEAGINAFLKFIRQPLISPF